MSGKNAQIRDELEELICEPINKIPNIQKKLHIIKAQNHTIEQLIGKQIKFPLDDGEFHYSLIVNCYSYALQLWRFPEFIHAAHDYTGEDNIILSEDVLAFIEAFKLQESIHPMPNDLVLYYGNGQLKHAGIFIASDLIESKWDKFGVFRHTTWHVPVSYGDRMVAYTLPEIDLIKQYFFKLLQLK